MRCRSAARVRVIVRPSHCLLLRPLQASMHNVIVPTNATTDCSKVQTGLIERRVQVFAITTDGLLLDDEGAADQLLHA